MVVGKYMVLRLICNERRKFYRRVFNCKGTDFVFSRAFKTEISREISRLQRKILWVLLLCCDIIYSLGRTMEQRCYFDRVTDAEANQSVDTQLGVEFSGLHTDLFFRP